MGPMQYIVYLFPILTIAALLGFFLWYWQTMRAPLAQQIAPMPEKKPFTFAGRRHPLVKKDAIPMVLITVAYAFTAFFNLGSTTAPRTPGILATRRRLPSRFRRNTWSPSCGISAVWAPASTRWRSPPTG